MSLTLWVVLFPELVWVRNVCSSRPKILQRTLRKVISLLVHDAFKTCIYWEPHATSSVPYIMAKAFLLRKCSSVHIGILCVQKALKIVLPICRRQAFQARTSFNIMCLGQGQLVLSRIKPSYTFHFFGHSIDHSRFCWMAFYFTYMLTMMFVTFFSYTCCCPWISILIFIETTVSPHGYFVRRTILIHFPIGN